MMGRIGKELAYKSNSFVVGDMCCRFLPKGLPVEILRTGQLTASERSGQDSRVRARFR